MVSISATFSGPTTHKYIETHLYTASQTMAKRSTTANSIKIDVPLTYKHIYIYTFRSITIERVAQKVFYWCWSCMVSLLPAIARSRYVWSGGPFFLWGRTETDMCGNHRHICSGWAAAVQHERTGRSGRICWTMRKEIPIRNEYLSNNCISDMTICEDVCVVCVRDIRMCICVCVCLCNWTLGRFQLKRRNKNRHTIGLNRILKFEEKVITDRKLHLWCMRAAGPDHTRTHIRWRYMSDRLISEGIVWPRLHWNLLAI